MKVAVVFFLLFVVFFSSNVSSASETRLVCPLADCPYQGVREAVLDAKPGDTILVKEGVYPGGFVVKKSLTIKSDSLPGGEGGVVIEGGDFGIRIEASRVVVEGLTVRGARGAGIEVFSNRNVLANNTFTASQVGVLLDTASGNILRGNAAVNNTGSGFSLVYSNFNVLESNRAEGNARGFVASKSSSNTLKDNIASGNRFGFKLLYAEGNYLTRDKALENDVGFYLVNSEFNTLKENNASLNLVGFHLQDSANNTISLNNLSLNTGIGISLNNSRKNLIWANTLDSNRGWGIALDNLSKNNTLQDNDFLRNRPWDTGENNTWELNHYQEFECQETPRGICENPYNIPGNRSTDPYPRTITPPKYTPTVIPTPPPKPPKTRTIMLTLLLAATLLWTTAIFLHEIRQKQNKK